MTSKTTALILASAVMVSSAAFAGSPKGMGHHGMGGQGMMDVDMDGDKAISKSEFDTKVNADFKKAAENGNAFDLEQFEEYMEWKAEQRRKDMAAKRFKMMDTNNDGKVSEAEFNMAGDKMFNMMDRNKDGQLNRDDRKKWHKNKGDKAE